MSRTTISAIRGAISVPRDEAEAIRDATARLLTALVEANHLQPSRIVSAIFTTTPDLTRDFPAHAARRLGWTEVPLLGATEMGVPGAMPRIVRVLLTVRTRPGAKLRPVYLDEAVRLRPDLARDPRTTRTRRTRRVAIVGLGQIGGSLGLALGRAGGWRRVGFDRDLRTLRAARAAGAIDEPARTLDAACSDADMAILALPVEALPAAVEQAAQALPRGAVLIDTGSARAGVSAAIARARHRGVRAIGGHPIAGTEGRGFASARADLFDGASFVLLPPGGRVPRLARELVAALGARVLVAQPRRHDAALARTSHLPYLIACALREAGDDAARDGLSGPGFASATRLAASDPRIALGYCRANARNVQRAWRFLRASIDRSVEELSGGRRGRGERARVTSDSGR
jgi:prephenate dehydrogenase